MSIGINCLYLINRLDLNRWSPSEMKRPSVCLLCNTEAVKLASINQLSSHYQFLVIFFFFGFNFILYNDKRQPKNNKGGIITANTM